MVLNIKQDLMQMSIRSHGDSMILLALDCIVIAVMGFIIVTVICGFPKDDDT